MKKDKLLNAFGEINECYILEAKPKINSYETRNEDMKSKKTVFYKRPMNLVAALVLCVCLSGAIVLASTGALQGFFADIISWNGAVVGTTYEQATSEIEMKVTDIGNTLEVELTMLYPERAPYSEFKEFGIKSYKIVDMNDKVILKETTTDMVKIADGKVTVSIPFDNVSNGDYKLVVSKMSGGKKADQPLVLNGDWEIYFSK